MSDIRLEPRIFNAGPVSITRDQDYRQFLLTVFLTAVVLLAVWWAWYSGILSVQVYGKLGPYFTLAFAVLLVAGLLSGMIEACGVSLGVSMASSGKNSKLPS